MASPTVPPAKGLVSGLLQQVQRLPGDQGYLVVDQIHGKHVISEPLLVKLMDTQPVQRLEGIHQHGVSSLLSYTPRVTRYEHCVGAMLIVRRAGGSLKEQAFGLLHDVSHTVLSHVMDWALSEPGTSYHEEHMQRYVASTILPEILAEHNLYLPDCMDEDLFPLVEQPSPHLCADRLDYALRDAVAFGKLSLPDAVKVSNSVFSYPSPESPRRMLVLKDESAGLVLARSYLASDRDVWSNPTNIDLYRRTGNIIRDLFQKGKLNESDLWGYSDFDFWEVLRQGGDEDQREDMRKMSESSREGFRRIEKLPPRTKVRTIDPDICKTPDEEPSPLSTLHPEYLLELQGYIASRRALMEASKEDFDL